MDMAIGESCARIPRHLGENRLISLILDLINGVESQAIEAKLFEPIEHIVDEELPHRLLMEGNGAAPWRFAHGVKETGCVKGQIIPVGPEMIVDHVEQHHEPSRMCCIYQALKALRAAIGAVGGVEQHAVIAPAAVARELR